MKIKKIVALSVLLIICFFAFNKNVYADENKVYWNPNLGKEGIGVGLRGINQIVDKKLSYNKNDIVGIYFIDKEKSDFVMDNFDVSTIDYGVEYGIKDNVLYIQYNGTLYWNPDSAYLFYDFSNLKYIRGLQYVDTSEVVNMNNLFANLISLEELDLSSFDTSNVIDMSWMFYDCESLDSLDLSHFNTSNVTNMSLMFRDCNSLKSLNLSSFNTSNVTKMQHMFMGCGSLTSLDLNKFNTTNVTNMEFMFNGCKNLESLNISNFNTSNVTDMSGMFKGCSSLITLNLNHFNVSNVTDMNNMFSNMSKLKELYIPFNINEGTLVDHLLNKDYNLQVVSLPNYNDYIEFPFYFTTQYGDAIYSTMDFSGGIENSHAIYKFINIPSGTIVRKLYNAHLYTDIDNEFQMIVTYYGAKYGDLPVPEKKGYNFLGWYDENDELVTKDTVFTETSNINLFAHWEEKNVYWNQSIGSYSLKTILLSLNNNTTFANLLNNVTSIVFNDISKTNSIVENFEYEIDISRDLDESVIAGIKDNVLYIQYEGTLFFNSNSSKLFQNFGLLTNISGFEYVNTSEVTNMGSMFSGLKKLTSLDLSSFDTSNVTDMSYMFSGCEKLASLNVSNFDTSKVTEMYGIFYGDFALKDLDLSSFDLSNLDTYTYYTHEGINYFFINAYPSFNRLVTPKKMHDEISISIDSGYGFLVNNNTIYKKLNMDTPTEMELIRSYCFRYQTGEELDLNAPLKCIKNDKTTVGELWTPTREKYNFNGWYTKNNFNYLSSNTKINEDTPLSNFMNRLSPTLEYNVVDIWAYWTPKVYNIFYYDSDGITLLGVQEAKYEKEYSYNSEYSYQYLEIPSFKKEGFKFEGWYIEPELINKFSFTGTIVGDKNLYAKWEPLDTEVSYTTHVQSYGWQDYVKDGEMAGTSGEAKRLEAIKIKLNNQHFDGDILYRTHIQSYGWENEFKKNDEMSGTSGEAKRLEAIEIKLTGEMAEHYDIYYRVHAQRYGWLGWARNGESSGTAGYAFRLEGIEIKLVEKGTIFEEYGKEAIFHDANTGSIKPTSDTVLVSYTTHVQSYGWQDYVADGEMAGTSGEAKRLEAIKIKLNNPKYDGDIEYRTHIQSYGWENNFRKNDEMSGTSGEAKRLEAIEIRLTGEMAEHYDVYYRVHAQRYGWLAWAKNGEQSGTAGFGFRLEGIEIVLVEKGEEPPVRDNQMNENSFIQNEN